jgi:NAD(P)-dependent dehydrogenase (short-subunit alcohol dehydrogenase family)
MASVLGQVGLENIAPASPLPRHRRLDQDRSLGIWFKGIRINSVGPAFINTALLDPLPPDVRKALDTVHALGRVGEPEEVANLVAWLSSDKASFITGSYYAADGGYLAADRHF